MAFSMKCTAASMFGVATCKDCIAAPSEDMALSKLALAKVGVDVSAKAGAAATPAAASRRRSRRQGVEVIVSCSFRFGRREGFLGRNVLLVGADSFILEIAGAWRVGISIAFDDAPDGRCHRGQLVVGKSDCRHGTRPPGRGASGKAYARIVNRDPVCIFASRRSSMDRALWFLMWVFV
jgi:hypothetical protein